MEQPWTHCHRVIILLPPISISFERCVLLGHGSATHITNRHKDPAHVPAKLKNARMNESRQKQTNKFVMENRKRHVKWQSTETTWFILFDVISTYTRAMNTEWVCVCVRSVSIHTCTQ